MMQPFPIKGYSPTGHSKTAPVKNYSVHGSGEHRLFGALNAISIIATTYGNGIIPEIQVPIVLICMLQMKIITFIPVSLLPNGGVIDFDLGAEGD